MAKSSLKTLIRLHKFDVDEKRRVLVALQTREDQIIAELERGVEMLAREQQVAAADSTEAGFIYGAFAHRWIDTRDQLTRMLEAVRAEIVQARDALADAFSQLKTFEISQRERERKEKAVADKKEQIFLDEIGLNQHRRRAKEEEQ